MSSSTTQPKQQNGAPEAVNDNLTSFQRELQKKIRNKQKKLNLIIDLEKKIKKKEIVANEEQLEKIQSKPAIEAEMAEVKSYLDLYNSSQAELVEEEKKLQKQRAKDVSNARKAVVTTIANMIAISTLLENGQTIPEELKAGVEHFSECISKFQARGQGDFHWRQERDCFIGCWTKLAQGSQDTVPHTDITFEELNTGVSELISSGGFPEVIAGTVKPKSGRQRKGKQYREKSQPPAEEEAQAEPEQPVQEEVQAQPEPEVTAQEEEEPAVEAEQPEEAAAEAEPEQEALQEGDEPEEEAKEEAGEEKGDGEANVIRGQGKQRGRGERRGRGEYRGRGERGRGGRGEFRGRGERGRGGRGGFHNRNEDADGFTIIKDSSDDRGRGRGRGGPRGRGEYRGRGQRGERGEHRGAQEIGTRGQRSGPVETPVAAE